MGTVGKGELAAALDAAAFSLPTGAVSDPIETRSGWHVLKVVEKLPATFKPYSEVKADILKKEQETQFQKKLAEYLEKLERDAVIKVSAEAAPYYQPPVAAPPARTPWRPRRPARPDQSANDGERNGGSRSPPRSATASAVRRRPPTATSSRASRWPRPSASG